MVDRFSDDAAFFGGDHDKQKEALADLQRRASAILAASRALNRALNANRHDVEQTYQTIPADAYLEKRVSRAQWALLNRLEIDVVVYEHAAAADDPGKSGKRGHEDVSASAPTAKRSRDQAIKDLKHYRYAGAKIHGGFRSGLSFTKETIEELYSAAPDSCPKCGTLSNVKGFKWSVDHKVPWSIKRFDARTVNFCHDGYHYTAVTQNDAQACYNDLGNLSLLCKSCNSSKGGVKGTDHIAPECNGDCPDPATCDLPKLTRP